MKKRWIGYAFWLLLAACLYFFENNTGTRAVLLCSLLIPLIPRLRPAFFSADETVREAAKKTLTVQSFIVLEADEPGEVRPYQPGDPIRRIHWKLSAKKDEILIRETAAGQEIVQTEQAAVSADAGQKKKARKRFFWLPAGVIPLCAALLLLIPEARRGAQFLCNEIFAASEQVNAYAYDYFPVPEGQSIGWAVGLTAGAFAALTALTVLLRSRLLILGVTAACTLFQVYFGLPFPAWINVCLYTLLALGLMRRPVRRQSLPVLGAVVLCASLLTAILLPGTDAATEAASERARDRLSRLAQQITGNMPESPEGETETRRTHTLSLEEGENEAGIQREYRLETVGEEQISRPHGVNYLKIILLLLLTAAVVSLPFAPFLLLNARRKKAREARGVFASENVSEAVCAIFRQVIAWLNETGHSAGNLLYRGWAEQLPKGLPEGYALRFARCAQDFEEAAYSFHELPEEKRRQALDLLQETEAALWKEADWKQRIRLKYWMCLRE